MAWTRRRLIGTAAIAASLAGCTGDGDGSGGDVDGGGGGYGGGAARSPTATTTGSSTTTSTGAGGSVRVGSHPELGDILVGPDGQTLYLFDSDTRGEPASTCTGGCAAAWPPLTADGEPAPGDGVVAELSTFERADGTTQVAADGWPLYYYASDREPGDASGQGVDGVWWVLTPAGQPIRD